MPGTRPGGGVGGIGNINTLIGHQADPIAQAVKATYRIDHIKTVKPKVPHRMHRRMLCNFLLSFQLSRLFTSW
jgi:hypothetical protein